MTKTRKTLNHGSLLHPNTHAFSTLVHQMCIQFGKKNKFNILAGKKNHIKYAYTQCTVISFQTAICLRFEKVNRNRAMNFGLFLFHSQI